MTRTYINGTLAVLLLSHAAAYAESANKCTDGKKITYANMPCEELGLKSIGPVKGAVVVVPAIKPPKEAPPEKPKKELEEKANSGNDEGDEVPKPVRIKPVNPLIEKLL